MRHYFQTFAAALCLVSSAVRAADQVGIAPSPASKAAPYLTPAAEPDELAVLAAPPAEHSAMAQAEHDLFTTTRGLADTPRWRLAIADADRGAGALWADFGCALGVGIPPERLPVLIDLIGRLNEDVEQATRLAKAHYQRVRPMVGNDAPICVARTDALAQSYSFPSGHATQGWATALVLAELVPDRATQVLQRGRVFGESRVICGVHWMSDVEAGRTAAAVLVAVLHGSADFRQDLDKARNELFLARQGESMAPDAALCHAGTDAAAHPLAE